MTTTELVQHGAPREVCYLIDVEGKISYKDTHENAGFLPDMRQRWEAIWGSRSELAVIAHSHPCGPAGFSEEDKSTMRAIYAALGPKCPCFAVIHPTGTIVWEMGAEGFEGQFCEVGWLPIYLEPAWALQLRIDSGMTPVTLKNMEV